MYTSALRNYRHFSIRHSKLETVLSRKLSSRWFYCG